MTPLNAHHGLFGVPIRTQRTAHFSGQMANCLIRRRRSAAGGEFLPFSERTRQKEVLIGPLWIIYLIEQDMNLLQRFR